MSLRVFAVLHGDCIEGGTNLYSLHFNLEDALNAAVSLIKREESYWENEPDKADWEYVEVPPTENKVLKYWKTRWDDIVVVTEEDVS